MMLSDVCLSDVCRRAACAAGRLDGAYWLIGPGSAGLAQGCRCGLPLQAWAGHIVAAARLQLVLAASEHFLLVPTLYLEILSATSVQCIL